MRGSRMLSSSFVAGPVLAACAACADRAPTAAEPAAAALADRTPSVAWPAAAASRAHPATSATAASIPTAVGGFTVQPLARGRFPDEVDITFRIKHGRGTEVAHVRDPSDVLAARLTFQPGGSVGWHTHHGPVIVTVASGALTLVDGDNCERRLYPAGTAFVDPGQGHVHLAFNGTAGETVVYATFLDVPAGRPATVRADNPGCRP